MSKGAVGIITAIFGTIFVIFGLLSVQDYWTDLRVLAILTFVIQDQNLIQTLDLVLKIMLFIPPKMLFQYDILIYFGIGLAVFGTIIASLE
ncbi:MAG: hypothetical protein ACTSO9_00850 [Candidatus Helarchaeota archaeon]